jgi:hypothetical protein
MLKLGKNQVVCFFPDDILLIVCQALFFLVICQLSNLELGDSTAEWSNLPGAEHLVYNLISGMSLNL